MSDGGAWIPHLGGFTSVQPDFIHADDEKQPTQISDPCCNSPFECIYLKPDHLTCIEMLDRTCHFFSCVAPVFIVQWLFDEEQLKVENIYMGGQSLSEEQWQYIQNLGKEIKNSLRDVT